MSIKWESFEQKLGEGEQKWERDEQKWERNEQNVGEGEQKWEREQKIGIISSIILYKIWPYFEDEK